MGTNQSKPTNKTGKAVVALKLQTASKTGVLSLGEHNLVSIPDKVFLLKNLRTLDLSNNKIKALSSHLSTLTNLKSLNLDSNKLSKGSVRPISNLTELTTLSLGNNNLGMSTDEKGDQISAPVLPKLPTSVKQVKLHSNFFQTLPAQLFDSSLVNLEKLDLSRNNLSIIPGELFKNLRSLVELNLDKNALVSLPREAGNAKKLKSLSLQNNLISVDIVSGRKSKITNFNEKNPQPLPASLFTETLLIDLNLKGNDMTNTQLNEFVGYDAFLQRRQKLKSKNIYGGALTDLSVCGLE